MTEKKHRFRFSTAVADTVRAQHGAFAHLYAVERLEKAQSNDRLLWLDVLAELDELDELERINDEVPKLPTPNGDSP
jgi:hypothetical protein